MMLKKTMLIEVIRLCFVRILTQHWFGHRSYSFDTMRHMSANNKQLLETDSDALPIKRRFRVPVWAIVLAIGAVLIALGIVQGDMLDTWRKASLICYECIGIG